MEPSRSKRRRLIIIASHVSSWPDLPARFESLIDDTLTTVLEFVGKKSYRSFGGLNKRCREIYLNTEGMTKETFLYGYAPLVAIIDKIERGRRFDQNLNERVGKGVVFYNRRDVLDWALQRQNNEVLLTGICKVATEEGRLNILNEVWNNIEDEDVKISIFKCVDEYAARGGKMNVLKWHETKGLSIDKKRCAYEAARHGQLQILEWLKEERGFELYGELYSCAAIGNQLHVMKWLREQEVDWSVFTFYYATEKGNLAILQWLHDEGCPWPDNIRVYESLLRPEVIQWLRTNGYRNRISLG